MNMKPRKSSSAERELERRKRRQEKYSNAMEDLTALRNHYRAEVREKLELKVAKQRKEREEKKALDQAAKDEKEKQQKHSFSVTLPKSVDVDDKFYLQNVKFSKFYIINEIRDQLEKNNELDKKYKNDEFNAIISSPGVLRRVKNEMLRGHQLTIEKIKKIAQEISGNDEKHHKNDSHNQQNSQAEEGIEQFQIDEDKQKREKLKSQRSLNSIETVFPTVEYPELVFVNQDLESQDVDPDKMEMRLKVERRRMEIEKRKQMVKRMFHVSQTYEAATNRLMKKYADLSFQELAAPRDPKEIFEQNDVEDVDGCVVNELLPIKAPTTAEMELNSNIYKYLASLDELPSTEILQVHVQGNRMTSRHSKSKRDSAKSNNYEKWGGRVYSDEKLRKEILGINEIKREPRKLAPLTMHALEETANVKKFKGPAMWINPEM